MSELLKLGVRQGTVIGFSEQLTEKSQGFIEIGKAIKEGRYGLFERKGVTKDYLYAVLTQDCSISNGQPIELAQLKKIVVRDEDKVQHLLLGKDYGKLYIKFNGDIYVAEEALLTKVKNDQLVKSLKSNDLCVKGSLTINGVKIILDWRLLAYRREPFPDKFNRTLGEYFKKSNYWFTQFLAKNQENIHSVRVFVTPEDEDGVDEYNFAITLVLTNDGKEMSEEISEALEKMINEFSKMSGVKGIQTIDFDVNTIDFPEHLILSFTAELDDFSFANAYTMREFNFQYLCY